jgi:hypothetical protein
VPAGPAKPVPLAAADNVPGLDAALFEPAAPAPAQAAAPAPAAAPPAVPPGGPQA